MAVLPDPSHHCQGFGERPRHPAGCRRGEPSIDIAPDRGRSPLKLEPATSAEIRRRNPPPILDRRQHRPGQKPSREITVRTDPIPDIGEDLRIAAPGDVQQRMCLQDRPRRFRQAVVDDPFRLRDRKPRGRQTAQHLGRVLVPEWCQEPRLFLFEDLSPADVAKGEEVVSDEDRTVREACQHSPRETEELLVSDRVMKEPPDGGGRGPVEQRLVEPDNQGQPRIDICAQRQIAQVYTAEKAGGVRDLRRRHRQQLSGGGGVAQLAGRVHGALVVFDLRRAKLDASRITRERGSAVAAGCGDPRVQAERGYIVRAAHQHRGDQPLDVFGGAAPCEQRTGALDLELQVVVRFLRQLFPGVVGRLPRLELRQRLCPRREPRDAARMPRKTLQARLPVLDRAPPIAARLRHSCQPGAPQRQRRMFSLQSEKHLLRLGCATQFQ